MHEQRKRATWWLNKVNTRMNVPRKSQNRVKYMYNEWGRIMSTLENASQRVTTKRFAETWMLQWCFPVEGNAMSICESTQPLKGEKLCGDVYSKVVL